MADWRRVLSPRGAHFWPLLGTFAIGAAFLVPAVLLAARNAAFLRIARPARGVVIAHEPDREGETYFPVVSFRTAAGGTHTFRGSIASSANAPTGIPVDVLYDPDDPSQARVKGFFSLWAGALALGTVALLVLGTGGS